MMISFLIHIPKPPNPVVHLPCLQIRRKNVQSKVNPNSKPDPILGMNARGYAVRENKKKKKRIVKVVNGRVTP